MIFYRAPRYLKYSLLSHHKRGHGIHSPFIFDVVTKIFRNKTDPDLVLTVERIRKKMISDKRRITVNDLGSGSGGLKTKPRKVSDVALNSPVPPKYGKLLSNMAAAFGEPVMIELGTSLGISTMYLAGSCRNATVYTIEGCHETASIARQNFVEAGFNNIKMAEGSFDDVLPEILASGVKPGLVFIDGNHRKEPVIRYASDIAMISDSKTVIIIDDINYSEEMAEAWRELKQHKKVTVSIDIFRMGILFFREGISHNNYVIRY
jgi:predicted O-methyltransferase YrrM